MGNLKKLKTLVLALCILFSVLVLGNTEVYAESIYSQFSINLYQTKMTLYLNQTDSSQYASIRYSTFGYSDTDFQNAIDKIYKDFTWKTSDDSVVSFVTTRHYDENGTISYETSGKIKPETGRITLIGLSEGTATITLTSSILNQSYQFKVTVKNAELDCDDEVFYDNNRYTFRMRGNATGLCYSSSDKSVAVVNKITGVVKTKKTGTTTISCIANDGKTYTYKLKVKKSGLSYKKLTTYYYTGLAKGNYTHFPLVAAGIDVKSWKSSNPKVCKVKNLGHVGYLQMMGTGKCTITCTSKNGKTYKCKLTVVGGKKWGGLSNGYLPTLSTIKKHGYFKDIHSVRDYGDVVVSIVEYDHKINLGNGNKPLTVTDADNSKKILTTRYPDASIKLAGGGDYLCFTNDDGKKSGRIWWMCYYVE